MAKEYANVYWNKTQDQALTPPGAPMRVVPWTPRVDRPLDTYSGRWESYDSYSGRVTWQVAPKHKIDGFIDHQIGCNCGSTSGVGSQEAGGGTVSGITPDQSGQPPSASSPSPLPPPPCLEVRQQTKSETDFPTVRRFRPQSDHKQTWAFRVDLPAKPGSGSRTARVS